METVIIKIAKVTKKIKLLSEVRLNHHKMFVYYLVSITGLPLYLEP